MNKPHKHAEVIKAWADGAKIETKLSNGEWGGVKSPQWWEDFEYRIKPEPKPDYVRYIGFHNQDGRDHSYVATSFATISHWIHKVKVTFDGETHEPKSVELIK
jgi:hypothetical protein